MSFGKKAAVLAGLLALLLGGCSFAGMDEGLYRLPKLPAEYESLEEQLTQLLSDGAEYASPTSGSNLQSVQMVDLDGDGEEEAVAFMRRASDERPMKIYVFRANRDGYERYCVIEGTSSSIYSIAYTDIDGDGWREILAGIRSSLDVQNLAIYSLATGEPQQLLLTGYSRYTARDIDGDGKTDLIVVRSDDESIATADYYAWSESEMELYSSLRLSSSVAELMRMSVGTLLGGENALFVTGVTEEATAITDILMLREGKLVSVLRGDSEEGYHFMNLYPGDVDSDGVTEVPEPVPFPQPNPDAPVYYRICWRHYSADGSSGVVKETFQSTQDGWTLTLPEGWGERVSVMRSGSADSSAVTFSLLREKEEPLPFVTIYTFTGESRDTQSRRGSRFQLLRQPEAVYAAELTDAAEGMIDEQGLRDRFAMIVSEWNAGEN